MKNEEVNSHYDGDTLAVPARVSSIGWQSIREINAQLKKSQDSFDLSKQSTPSLKNWIKSYAELQAAVILIQERHTQITEIAKTDIAKQFSFEKNAMKELESFCNNKIFLHAKNLQAFGKKNSDDWLANSGNNQEVFSGIKSLQETRILSQALKYLSNLLNQKMGFASGVGMNMSTETHDSQNHAYEKLKLEASSSVFLSSILENKKLITCLLAGGVVNKRLSQETDNAQQKTLDEKNTNKSVMQQSSRRSHFHIGR